jgi:hypothetical protein
MLNGSMIGRETAKFVSRNPDHIYATTIFNLVNFTRRTSRTEELLQDHRSKFVTDQTREARAFRRGAAV